MQVGAERYCRLHGRKRSVKLIADCKRKLHNAVYTLLCMAARASLLKQDANGTEHIGVGRSFSIIKIIEALFGVVEAFDAVERLGVIFRNGGCEILIDLRCQRIGSGWYSRLEKIGGVGAHFMLIGNNIWAPFMKFSYSAAAFGMLNRHPVAVEIEPVVVGSSAGPYLIKFARIGVGYRGGAFMDIYPSSKTVQAIGVKSGIQENNRIFQHRIHFNSCCRSKVVGCQHGGVGPAWLVSMNAMSQRYDYGHVVYVKITAGVGVRKRLLVFFDGVNIRVIFRGCDR